MTFVMSAPSNSVRWCCVPSAMTSAARVTRFPPSDALLATFVPVNGSRDENEVQKLERHGPKSWNGPNRTARSFDLIGSQPSPAWAQRNSVNCCLLDKPWAAQLPERRLLSPLALWRMHWGLVGAGAVKTS
jgi:hypothetical protein